MNGKRSATATRTRGQKQLLTWKVAFVENESDFSSDKALVALHSGSAHGLPQFLATGQYSQLRAAMKALLCHIPPGWKRTWAMLSPSLGEEDSLSGSELISSVN